MLVSIPSAYTQSKHCKEEWVNQPEVRPQIQDLPHPKHDQDEGGAQAKPLDAVVGALVGVAQLLLPRPQVVHLVDDLGHHLLHAAQVRLDRLELLGCLDRRPVLGVCAYVDVQLDVAVGVGDVLGCFAGSTVISIGGIEGMARKAGITYILSGGSQSRHRMLRPSGM